MCKAVLVHPCPLIGAHQCEKEVLCSRNTPCNPCYGHLLVQEALLVVKSGAPRRRSQFCKAWTYWMRSQFEATWERIRAHGIEWKTEQCEESEAGFCATHILAREFMYPPKQECLTPLTMGSGIEFWLTTFDWEYIFVYSLLFSIAGVKLSLVKQCSIEEIECFWN